MGSQPVIRNRDFHFARRGCVFIHERETVEGRGSRKGKNEGGVAFRKRETQSVIVEKEGVGAEILVRNRNDAPVGADEIDRRAAIHSGEIFRGITGIIQGHEAHCFAGYGPRRECEKKETGRAPGGAKSERAGPTHIVPKKLGMRQIF